MPSSVTATCFARASRDWNGTRPEAEADCGVATFKRSRGRGVGLVGDMRRGRAQAWWV